MLCGEAPGGVVNIKLNKPYSTQRAFANNHKKEGWNLASTLFVAIAQFQTVTPEAGARLSVHEEYQFPTRVLIISPPS
jgi:hypothetical protein